MFELLISIVLSSMILIMLMQVLMMGIAAQNQLAQDTRLSNESIVISDSIKLRIDQLGPQEIELIHDTLTETRIEIRHLYDVSTDGDNVIERQYLATPITDVLIFYKEDGYITYNGDQINDISIAILNTSTIELVSIDPVSCDLATDPCTQGVLKLTLVLEITLANGHPLAPQTFVTTIII